MRDAHLWKMSTLSCAEGCLATPSLIHSDWGGVGRSDEEEHHAVRKGHEVELQKAQMELESCLQKEVLPRGYSKSFVSTNLARFGTLHPSSFIQGRNALADLHTALEEGVANPIGADLQGKELSTKETASGVSVSHSKSKNVHRKERSAGKETSVPREEAL